MRSRLLACLLAAVSLSLAALLLVPAFREGIAWRVDGWMPGPSEAQLRFERDMWILYGRGDPFVPAGAVLVFGDSHLHGVPLAIGSLPVVNLSIGGGAAGRLSESLRHVASLPRASVVVVELGNNDLVERRSADSVVDAIAGWIDRLPKGPQVVCVGLLPRAPRAADADVRVRINQRMRQACETRSALFVDSFAAVADTSGHLPPANDSGDGTHLSEAGYRQWLRAISDGVQRAAQR